MLIFAVISPDLEILVQHIKYIRTMVDIEPFQSGVVREVDPGPNYVTDQDIRGLLFTFDAVKHF
jgi:hypothetical protein